MKNLEIAKILYNIADILELQEVQFKPYAYRHAAQSIEELSEDITEIYEKEELEKISGVGKHIAEKIEEYIETGKIKYYQKLKKEIKVDIEQLNQVPSLGPKKIKILYKKLKIKNIRDLEKAIKKNKLRKLSGFGEETEKNLLRGIKFVKNRPNRFLYAHLQPIVKDILKHFSKLKFVKKIEVAGSFRRGKETIGDLDFLAVSKEPEKVMKVFTSLPDIKTVLAKGKTKSSILLKNGLQIDLRVVKEKEFGSAQMYFIGSKEHNIALRKLALSKGYTLNEYGLFKLKPKKYVCGKTQQQIYKKLNLQYIEPELRENWDEIQTAQKKKLPKLIVDKDIKGVFHNHTKWSDGSNSLLEMVGQAKKLKFKFISFNDHFGTTKIANPLDEKRLTKYLKEINKVQKQTNLKVYSGIEIDILKDGKLPLTKSKLKKLDVVVASVHLSLNMSEQEMTKRVCYALENYPVNILGHPTDRLINHREALRINLNKVFNVAKNTNTFLEINSSPERMDLSATNVKSAKELGCKFALGTDAHDRIHLESYNLGLNNARKGWLTKKYLLNCWNFKKIESALNK